MAKYYTCPRCGRNLDHGEECVCGWADDMEFEGIVNIDIEHIHPHPNNPRKDLGDLSELTESIRKKGIMQNLTVVPSYEPGEYIIVIGHRRTAAAKEAGLKELPCRVVKEMTENEQLGAMLEENMQRNDLTIIEQAQGFQLMLDLGETEDSIAEKTGFSKTTVRHRLNIAKLDESILENKLKDNYCQVKLADLYELEKIKDINKRNEILKNAYNSNNIIYAVNTEIEKERAEANYKQLAVLFESLGIQKAPREYEKEKYSGKWETVKSIYIGDEDFSASQESEFTVGDDMYYGRCAPSYVNIIKRAEWEEREEKTEEEIARERTEADRKEIKDLLDSMEKGRRFLVDELLKGSIKALNEAEAREKIWEWFVRNGAFINDDTFAHFFTGKGIWSIMPEERKTIRDSLDKYTGIQTMFMVLHETMSWTDINGIIDNDCRYNRKKAERLKSGYEIFSRYLGWVSTNEEDAIIGGTSELYKGEI